MNQREWDVYHTHHDNTDTGGWVEYYDHQLNADLDDRIADFRAGYGSTDELVEVVQDAPPMKLRGMLMVAIKRLANQADD